MYRTKITLSLSTLLLLLLCAASYFWSGPPSDRVLEERFRSRGADFNRLVSMFKEDSQLGEVTLEAAYLPYHPGSEKHKANLSPQRMIAYRSLIKSNGLTAIKRGTRGEIFLAAFEVDMERWKGYVYAELPPSPLVSSLDDTKEIFEKPQAQSMTTSGYKRIADNWYLYLDILTG